MRLRSMHGSDAAVTSNGPLMAHDDRLRSPARGLSETITQLAGAFRCGAGDVRVFESDATSSCRTP
jgi:hypothetical protein